MTIPDPVRGNFETLRRAFNNGDVCLMECTSKLDVKQKVYVIAAVNVVPDADGGHEYQLIPYGVMDTNVADNVNPPTDTHHSMGEHA
jgi:hypothetical protein